MNYEDIIAAWNNQADKHNQWSDLGEDEKLEWAISLERDACAKLCQEMWTGYGDLGAICACAIRQRGEH